MIRVWVDYELHCEGAGCTEMEFLSDYQHEFNLDDMTSTEEEILSNKKLIESLAVPPAGYQKLAGKILCPWCQEKYERGEKV